VKPTTDSVAPKPSRPNARSCPAARPEVSKIFHSWGESRSALTCAWTALRAAGASRPVASGVEDEGGAVLADQRQPLGADVDGDDVRAERPGDLHAEAAHPAGADEDGHVPRAHPGADDGLVGGRDGVGEHRQVGELQAGAPAGGGVDLAQAAAGHDDVGGEAAVDVRAGEDLLAADRGAAGAAQRAGAAGDDRRHHHLAPDERGVRRPGVLDDAGDLVPEHQRERLARPDAVVEEAEVGVADAAAGDAHHHLVGAQRVDHAAGADQRGADLDRLPGRDLDGERLGARHDHLRRSKRHFSTDLYFLPPAPACQGPPADASWRSR
jgi:hypothetical protein